MDNVQRLRAPFFGRYILETTGNIWENESDEDKREKEIRLQEIYETIDDYVEQA